MPGFLHATAAATVLLGCAQAVRVHIQKTTNEGWGDDARTVGAMMELPLVPRATVSSTFDKVMVSLTKEMFEGSKLAVLTAGTDSDAFDCQEIAKFLKQFSFRAEKLQALTIFSQTKQCTGTSSIVNPGACDSVTNIFSSLSDTETVEKLVKEAVPGQRAEFLSDDAISDLVKLQQAAALGHETIEALISETSKTIFDVDKLDSIKRFLEENPKQLTDLQVMALALNLVSEESRIAFAKMIRQRVVGLSCVSLLQILKSLPRESEKLAFMEEMMFNLVDPQNKHVLIEALPSQESKTTAAKNLGDICGRDPPNNPVFGRVEGDPVLFIIDKKESMAQKFELGGKSYKRDNFCMHEFAMVLMGLPPTSRFQVIDFARRAYRIFHWAVPASEDNIRFAMSRILQYKLPRTTNTLQALKYAYSERPSPKQIYFLSDSAPDQNESVILAEIDGLDRGRRIPVNTIAFTLPGHDEKASNFMESLAKKTGGFFRPVEGETLTSITDATPLR